MNGSNTNGLPAKRQGNWKSQTTGPGIAAIRAVSAFMIETRRFSSARKLELTRNK